MPATKERLQDVKLDIEKEAREKLVKLLNQALADTFDLVTQFKQAHWNVRGASFWQFHLLFDEAHEALEPFVDTIAERISLLGGVAMGTVRMAASSSSVKEFPSGLGEGLKFAGEMRDRLAEYAGKLREWIEESEEIGDPTTEDLLTEASRAADKQLYFLESHFH